MTESAIYAARTAESYDDRHFGGRSGQFLLRQECTLLAALLGNPRGRVLDIPCGTGVHSASLAELGYEMVAADASGPMLERAGRAARGGPTVLCDIRHLPFADGAFQATITLRLSQHYPAPAMLAILRELARVTAADGRVIFDTFRWTPRSWPIAHRLLSRNPMHVYTRREVEDLLRGAGLEKVGDASLHLFSPIWQRRLPLSILRGVVALERLAPPRWLLRTLWACRPRKEQGCR